MKYNCSKDYKKLFKLVYKGFEAIAFVDYYLTISRTTNDKPCREVATVYRFDDYCIQFGVRGIGYGIIPIYQRSKAEIEEEFLILCARENVEWIDPSENEEERI